MYNIYAYIHSFIYSGGSKEISCYEDIEKFRRETGTSSVMIARVAMWNCSILRPEGRLPIDTVVSVYSFVWAMFFKVT